MYARGGHAYVNAFGVLAAMIAYPAVFRSLGALCG